MRRPLRDRGATDPILVIAAIAVSLVLLVGGTFAVTGLLDNGRDLNARTDLDKVATAEQAAAAAGPATYRWDGTATGRRQPPARGQPPDATSSPTRTSPPAPSAGRRSTTRR